MSYKGKDKHHEL